MISIRTISPLKTVSSISVHSPADISDPGSCPAELRPAFSQQNCILYTVVYMYRGGATLSALLLAFNIVSTVRLNLNEKSLSLKEFCDQNFSNQPVSQLFVLKPSTARSFILR
jgi:hypothetical protein